MTAVSRAPPSHRQQHQPGGLHQAGGRCGSWNKLCDDDNDDPLADRRGPCMCILTLFLRMQQWFEAHRGHNQLGIRGCLVLLQAVLTASLMLRVEVFAELPVTLACQLVTSLSLLIHWRTGYSGCFVLRACMSFVRCVNCLYWSICGRVWLSERCEVEGWWDVREPLRILHVAAAVRQLANGISLMLQHHGPQCGVSERRGHPQLLYRGIIRCTGVFVQFPLGVVKLTALEATRFERDPWEVVVNFSRSIVAVLESFSLWEQWRTAGARPSTLSRASAAGRMPLLLDTAAVGPAGRKRAA